MSEKKVVTTIELDRETLKLLRDRAKKEDRSTASLIRVLLREAMQKTAAA